MKIIDIFSKRQKKLRGELPDVYQYKTIPEPIRIQIIHIWRDTLGNESQYHDQDLGTQYAYKQIVEALCREYGLFELPGAKHSVDRHYLEELANFLLSEQDIEKVLDAIELSFRATDRRTRCYDYRNRNKAATHADDAISELNARFKEHAVGFQYTDSEIIRVDSELIHAGIVKPALNLLRDPEYAGAQAEFLKAHEHYRHGNSKETLSECLKALESVMKTICDKHTWKYDPRATCNTLIQTCLDNGLIPSFWLQHFSSLRAMLESGVPTARNRLSGHGQGSAIVEVPSYLSSYALHMTATTILFLAEAEKGTKDP